MQQKHSLLILVALALLVCAATSVSAAIVRVTIVKAPIAPVPVKGVFQFAAKAFDERDRVVTAKFVWTVEPVEAGTVSTSGKFTAGCTPMTARVTAALVGGELSHSADFEISIGAPYAVVVDQQSPTITYGSTFQFTATVNNVCGKPIEGAEVTWSVSSRSAGMIDPITGEFTADKPGKYTVTATSKIGKKKGKTTIFVVPLPPAKIRLFIKTQDITDDGFQTPANTRTNITAKGLNEEGEEIPYLKYKFSVSESIGTIVPTSGLFTAGKVAGRIGTIIAEAVYLGEPIGEVGGATVTILPAAPKKVNITPQSVSLSVGETQSFSAKVLDAYNNEIKDAAIAWSLASPKAGTIDPETGDFVAGSVLGTYQVKAKATTALGSATGSANVTVIGETAKQHIQRLITADDWDDLDIAAEFEWFKKYRAKYPNDDVGRLGYSITRVGYAAVQMLTKYMVGMDTVKKLTTFQGTMKLLTAGDISKLGSSSLDLVFRPGVLVGGGEAPGRLRAGGRTNAIGLAAAPTPAQLAADIRNILIPALQDATNVLAPTVNRTDVIAAFTNPSGEESHVRAEEVRAYRAGLQAISVLLCTATAYSWDDRGFNWNRTPGQMDANRNGRLEPSEYLPGGTFLTLTHASLLTAGWNALNGALADALAAAEGMMSSTDPLQLLALVAPTLDWLIVYAGAEAVQRALAGPTVIPIPYSFAVFDPDFEVWDYGEVSIPVTVNLRDIWTGPTSNLRTLMPTYSIVSNEEYECSYLEVYSIPDKTFGGLLPYGDTEIPDALWSGLFGMLKDTDCPRPAIEGVFVMPKSVSLYTQQSTIFRAIVIGGDPENVAWDVEELGGGTVDVRGGGQCLYTAPTAPGTYHVIAMLPLEGGGFATDRATIVVTPAPSSEAYQHIQALLSAEDPEVDWAAELAWFTDYRSTHPDDDIGRLGYSVARMGDVVSALMDEYSEEAFPFGAAGSFQRAIKMLTSGRVTQIVGKSLRIATGRGLSSRLGGVDRLSFSVGDIETDIRDTLIPALQDAIGVIAPLTTKTGVIASFMGPDSETVHIRLEEVRAYRAALRLVLGFAATAVAYTWDDGGFDWNRTPVEMDINFDGFLEPSEYLPTGTFGTLARPQLITTGMAALTGALTDAEVVSNNLTAAFDPLQLLARQRTIPWVVVYAAVQAAERLMSGPAVHPFKYTDDGTGSDVVIHVTVNLPDIWTTPAPDLKALAPTLEIGLDEFDRTQLRIHTIPDKTLHGLLPYGATEIPNSLWRKWFRLPGDDDYGSPDYEVIITPGGPTVPVGGQVQFWAQIFTTSGDEVIGEPIEWSVINAQAGSIDQNGLFTAGAAPGFYYQVIKATAPFLGAWGYQSVTVE